MTAMVDDYDNDDDEETAWYDLVGPDNDGGGDGSWWGVYIGNGLIV